MFNRWHALTKEGFVKKFVLRMVVISNLFVSCTINAGSMGTVTRLSESWTGFYIGGNLGTSWNKINAQTNVTSAGAYFYPSDATQIAAVGIQRKNNSTFIGGGQMGYNLQQRSLIFGIEAEIDSFRISSAENRAVVYTSDPTYSFTLSSATNTKWLFMLKPKIGYTTDRWLLYATGGLAMTDLKHNFQFNDNFFSGATERASTSQRYGWTAGAGLEMKLSPAWSLRGEYLYVDFDSASASGVVYNNAAVPPLAVLSHQAKLSSQNITIGINYKFV